MRLNAAPVRRDGQGTTFMLWRQNPPKKSWNVCSTKRLDDKILLSFKIRKQIYKHICNKMLNGPNTMQLNCCLWGNKSGSECENKKTTHIQDKRTWLDLEKHLHPNQSVGSWLVRQNKWVEMNKAQTRQRWRKSSQRNSCYLTGCSKNPINSLSNKKKFGT